MTRRRLIVVIGETLLLLLSAACAHEVRPVAVLDNGGECPEWSDEELPQWIQQLSHDADTLDLQCALEWMRAAPARFEKSDAGARISFLLADRTGDQQRREDLAVEGVSWAERAIAAGAVQDGSVHYYLAVNLGLSVRSHVSRAIKTLPRLVSELEKAEELSPGVDAGGPMRVLGMAYLVAPPWPTGIGDADKALEYLTQAVERYPDHPLNHLFYAQVLWDIDQYAAEEELRAQLTKSCQLIGAGGWGGAGERWRRDITSLAAKAGLQIQACLAPEEVQVGSRP